MKELTRTVIARPEPTRRCTIRALSRRLVVPASCPRTGLASAVRRRPGPRFDARARRGRGRSRSRTGWRACRRWRWSGVTDSRFAHQRPLSGLSRRPTFRHPLRKLRIGWRRASASPDGRQSRRCGDGFGARRRHAGAAARLAGGRRRTRLAIRFADRVTTGCVSRIICLVDIIIIGFVDIICLVGIVLGRGTFASLSAARSASPLLRSSTNRRSAHGRVAINSDGVRSGYGTWVAGRVDTVPARNIGYRRTGVGDGIVTCTRAPSGRRSRPLGRGWSRIGRRSGRVGATGVENAVVHGNPFSRARPRGDRGDERARAVQPLTRRSMFVQPTPARGRRRLG